MGSDEQEVREAHAAFYDAFAERDVDAMEDVWSFRSPVTCIHPGWSLLVGREAVMASWRSILEGPAAPELAYSRELIHLYGEIAVVTCVETLADGQLMATNVFLRELGHWKMVHHQAGPISPTSGYDEDDDEDDDDDETPPGFLN